ncbi:Protein enhancer of rudimentary [Stylophora pistillata]|uniref:Protein enhancer of rudimentary n=1 Tax=Stylophora pistillata TaxID=50429 RepID=A0A2B4RL99_STYPI|nr:Protein enhancer of rudimentary [Stylophora pistillata]
MDTRPNRECPKAKEESLGFHVVICVFSPISNVLFANMSHTILLIQPSAKPESRTYSDYETKDECMEGRKTDLGAKKEGNQTKLNPQVIPGAGIKARPQRQECFRNCTASSPIYVAKSQVSINCILPNYEANQQHPKQTSLYEPHNKEWIKENIYIMLRKQAGK